ncbi:putative iron transport multicopper oxidase FET3 [Diplogelasinospora grovesii]|uniref:Iron transport multicopper oxidase FET3 n=1 Tax=Diplogelasinospora grovesii TaxID=303347 RepID=A0AAN6NAL2_9PEZI|nr:putative iron transport multicopper oxidase FET3 [Diplogelasinospora grovesii]
MLPSSVLSLVALALAPVVRAGTVTYNWDVTWVWANPDGKFARPLIGINNQWPCPKIEATVGDTVVVNLSNKLGNETSGLHFHGINQINTPDMDGPSGVTQCPVPPGSSITYQFVADAPGTYWCTSTDSDQVDYLSNETILTCDGYTDHSHNMGQYPDGLRGPMIVHDPNDPYAGKYDEEVIMTVSDWYYSQTIDLVRKMLTPTNTRFIPPFPDNILVNEGQGANINFVKGKTYRIRLISFAAFGSAMFHFDSHTMQVIMNDGAYIKQNQAYQLRIAPAQRYDFLISAIDRDHGNYPFLFSLDINRDFSNAANGLQWPHNFTGYLVMDPKENLTKQDVVSKWKPDDDSHWEPYNGAGPLGPYDKLIKLDFAFCMDANGYPRSCFNNKTYIDQKVPALYTAATTGQSNTNPDVYGQISPFIVNSGDIVQIVVNNLDAAVHPFHLHGHHFQVLDRPRSGAGSWSGRDVNYADAPPMRDTVSINANSHAVLRYKADNAGVFLFHCHIEWHVEMGLTATIIEAPDKLRGMQFPSDHIENCKLMNIPYKGNAAGNTVNYTDQTGFITVPPTTYNGALYNPPSSKRSRIQGSFKGPFN